MVSCGNLGEIGGDYKDGIVITLKGAGAVTKADTPTPKAGVDTLNENKVASLCYFIYDASGSLLHSGNQSFSPALTITEPTAIRLNVSEEEFDAIFTTARPTVKMYLVANVDASKFSGLSAKSDIQAVEVAIQNGGAKQDNFVMSGEGDVSKTTDGTIFKATGSVDLTRSLAKISFNLNIRSYYAEIDGHEYIPGPGGNEGTIDVPIDFDPTDPSDYTQYWTPQYANMVVTFHNGAQNGTVAGTPLASPTLFDLTGSYSTTPDESDGTNYIDKFYCKLPYYTYARTWEEYQPSAAAGDTQPYFLIMLPWKKHGETTYQSTWYKIVLNSHEFVANAWYNITVALNGLGSLTNGEPIEVYPLSFNVGEWRQSAELNYFDTETEVQSDEVRVLAFDQHEFTLNNQNSITIPFTTTHDCIISKIELKYVKYESSSVSNLSTSATGSSSTISLANPSGLPSKTATATISDGHLTFSHELVNDFTKNPSDYQPYTYTITERHKDNSSSSATIVITQNPGLIIGYAGKKENTVYVNKNHSQNSGWDTAYGSVSSSGSNSSPYVYSITVSQLSESGMRVGDPRVATYQNASQLGISNPDPQSAPALYDGASNRTLKYYYRTDPSKTDIIAPKFSVSSSYGQLGGNNLTASTAIYRCATYQEIGKPAGRWRLATEAELDFIGNLCVKGLIPSIFADNYYWAASGAFQYTESSGTFSGPKNVPSGSKCYARCVYDDWYWDNTDYPSCSADEFTWGDMPKK